VSARRHDGYLCKRVGPIIGSKRRSEDRRHAEAYFQAPEYPPFGALIGDISIKVVAARIWVFWLSVSWVRSAACGWAELLAAFAGRCLPALGETWERGGGHLRVLLSGLLFCYPAASPELLAEIGAFLSTRHPGPGLARVLADCRDMVERALRSRALRG
jgi:hypothetical protein